MGRGRWGISAPPIKWPLTLIFERATWSFLKLDHLRIDREVLKINSDMGHCHFLKSTGDIGLFFKIDRKKSKKVTGDIAIS